MRLLSCFVSFSVFASNRANVTFSQEENASERVFGQFIFLLRSCILVSGECKLTCLHFSIWRKGKEARGF